MKNVSQQDAYLAARVEYEQVEDRIREVNLQIEADPSRRFELKQGKLPLQQKERELKRKAARLRDDEWRKKLELRIYKRVAKAAAEVNNEDKPSEDQWDALGTCLEELDKFSPGWDGQ